MIPPEIPELYFEYWVEPGNSLRSVVAENAAVDGQVEGASDGTRGVAS